MFRRKASPGAVARRQMKEAGKDLKAVGSKAADAARATVQETLKARHTKRLVKHGQATQEAFQDVAKTAMKAGKRRAKAVAKSKEMKRAKASTRKAAQAARIAAQASSATTGTKGRMAAGQARASSAAAARKAQARALRAARKSKV